MAYLIKRLSLWHKIVGLITVLLFVMLLIAIYSHVTTLEAHDDIQDLNATLLPIVKRLSKIEVHSLRQGIHYERAARPGGGVDAEAVRARELAIFKSLGQQTRKEIDAVGSLTSSALTKVSDVDDAIELARIESKLQVISKDHKAFEDVALELLSNMHASEPSARAEHMKRLEKQEDQLFENLALVIYRMDDFVIQQANRVVAYDQERTDLSWQLLGIALIAFLLGTILATLVTRRILEPIHSLRQSASAVAQGELDIEVKARSNDEIGELAKAFNQMVLGLRERESIKETFSRYVDPRIAGHLLSPGIEDSDGDRRVMTVFFSDMEGFTTISEQLTPKALVKLINHYLAEMSAPIQEEDGIIDKFIGDAIMAYWGPPFVRDQDQALLGCRAGLACLDRIPLFQEQVPEITGLRKNAPKIRMRIGLATGPVLIGNIGSRKIRNYTLMGDTVNLAARLEGACKAYGLPMLISEGTAEAVKEQVLLREIDAIAVKGKSEPSRIFQPLGFLSDIDAAAEGRKESFEIGLAAYRSQNWQKARRAFGECSSGDSLDPTAEIFLNRITMLEQEPPEADWDGIWRMTTK